MRNPIALALLLAFPSIALTQEPNTLQTSEHAGR
jgi:hypothetical protein